MQRECAFAFKVFSLNAPLNKYPYSSPVSSQPSHAQTLSVQHPTLGTRKLPHYTTAGSAGLDLRAAIGEEETLTLAPGERALIPTGLIFHLSLGFEARIRPRSGLALKHGHYMPQHSKND